MRGNILIMAAGTGGHVFPALACAEEFKARGYQVHWLGAGRGIEMSWYQRQVLRCTP